MDRYRVVTADQRPDLIDAMRILGASPWPDFLVGHDEVVNALWDRLYEHLGDYQFALLDPDSEAVIAVGNCLPIRWDGDASSLPPRGIDAVLEDGMSTLQAGAAPAAVSALMIVIDPDRLGRGLSRACIEVMRGIAADHGLAHLVAPVRPTGKHRYPLVPMEQYASWRRNDGSLFDPWLRTHERVGGIAAGFAPASMTIRGSVAEWEAWTGLPMPGTGSYVVAEALVPVEVDREQDVGLYVEPNCWMVHRAG